MQYSLCIGAYPGQDALYHLRKIKEHGFGGLELYAWWQLGDLSAFAREQEKIGAGIIATCTKEFNLVDPAKREDYLAGLRETIEACRVLGTRSIITQTGAVREGVPREEQRDAMVETLKRSAQLLEGTDLVLEVEPLNGLVDHPGHFLQASGESAEVIDRVGSDRVKLVFDVYHQQITEGNVIRNAVQYAPQINHYHIADNPGRKQPGTGELNYINILRAIRDTGFNGYVGLECGYTTDTDEALLRFKEEIASKV
ncbi:TIM barrel protein [Paenibacillus mucilaginosus]|uniref:Xylose isomerase n=2 Tax=Paenibacillus mucilaginosus TaxID=61624 RepID=I0BS59_9BACL|nr:TIM barrel protein [Paenibacillus mucilaginosus]AEI45150.1 xylose isomerase domain-containing protein [Paenibacillus mucilaginosus KNP414]AFH65206.1 xylose isomerase [Paenibacillus mucilaginosus K02]MCG7212955.1 TIM barrel protein [Paenibacillus mucilaginosus]WDM26632.1 TIM barrel protein [Paenibacillus mucilaginosus]